jgi:nitroimidazol reductase NimA-like FMN-containing flavoprotein (pyridoxamine 5'-phosphate oxidase superfamily)
MSEKIDNKESLQILSNNYIGHLAYISNDAPYILPITYYYDPKENTILSYSSEGHKINAMRLNGAISIQIEEIESINSWKSVLIIGDFEELKGSEAKMHLHNFAQNVKNIISKKEAINPESINSFTSKLESDSIPIIYRINIQEIIGRKKLP